MIKRAQVLLIAVMLLLVLTGCGRLKAAIPHHIVTTAVAQQAQQEQIQLWRQLSADTEALPQLSVGRVQVSQVRQVKVANELAYEVTGTYRYTLRYPQRSPLKQSRIPFSLILQSRNDPETWQLLEIEGTTAAPKAWRWQSLTSEST